MDVAFITFLIAGIACVAYALGALGYELTLVFSNQESGSLSRYTQPHIFWRAAFIGGVLIAASIVVKIYQFLM
jgi:hypothetical protein